MLPIIADIFYRGNRSNGPARIGPRSGKSFLLNKLLGLPCSKGFGVGHMRETQTKGVHDYRLRIAGPSAGPRARPPHRKDPFDVDFTLRAGLWVWGAPRELTVGGERVFTLLIDTEGFESAGRCRGHPADR